MNLDESEISPYISPLYIQSTGVCLMTSLFVLELNAWLTIDTTTRIVLDSNGDDTMQVDAAEFSNAQGK